MSCDSCASMLFSLLSETFSMTQAQFESLKSETKLDSEKLKEDVSWLKKEVFRDCVELVPNHADFSYEKLFECLDKETLSKIPKKKLIKRIRSPMSVKYIGEYTFFSSDMLEELVIPMSVEVISRNCFAFCELLSCVKF